MADLPSTLDAKDLYPIIELAAKRASQTADTLSAEELRRVGAELDLTPEQLSAAVNELKRRRAQMLAKEKAAAALRKKIALGVAAVAVVLLVWMLILQSGLRAAWHQVEGRKAQLINVIDRQKATVAQWENQADSPDRSAEISGSENRVRVERKRYDKAATTYNTKADGLVSGMARGLFGLPTKALLSNEIDTW